MAKIVNVSSASVDQPSRNLPASQCFVKVLVSSPKGSCRYIIVYTSIFGP